MPPSPATLALSPPTAPLRAVRRVFAALGSLAALLAGPRLHADTPWQSASAYWEDYTPDADTEALYHLDDGEWLQRRLIRSVENSANFSRPGSLIGFTRTKEDARLRGYLDICGSPAQLRIPIAGGQPARTLEWRIRLKALPKASSTLAFIRMAPTETAAEHAADLLHWQILPDGELRLYALGRPVPIEAGVRLEPLRWVHLAAIWGRRSADEDVLRFYLDGREIGRETLAAGSLPTDEAAQAIIGDAGEGESGWPGHVDEVRLSTTMRTWYHADMAAPGSIAGDMTLPGKEAAKLTFFLPFDGGSLRPLVFHPNTELPDQLRNPDYVDEQPRLLDAEYPMAVRERGMHLGAEFERPIFQAGSHIALVRGSMAFWMRPYDWDTLTQRLHWVAEPPAEAMLFRVIRTDQQLDRDILLRTQQPPQDMMSLVVSLNPKPGGKDEGPPLQLHPGAWTHVIVTWDGPKVAWYFNGERRPSGGPFDLRLPYLDADDPIRHSDWRNWTDMMQATFQLGEKSVPPEGTPWPSTVIDELRIYDSPLTAEEAAAVYVVSSPQGQETLPEIESADTGPGTRANALKWPWMWRHAAPPPAKPVTVH